MNISPKDTLNISKNDFRGFKTMVYVGSDIEQNIVDKLLSLDCKVYIPKSNDDAIEKLRYHPFHIVIIADHNIEPIQVLRHFPMSMRRYTFFVLIGKHIETNNLMQSFVLNCNLIVNKDDLEDFSSILIDAMEENQVFFKPLIDALENMF